MRPHTTPYEEAFDLHFDLRKSSSVGTECFARVPKTKRSKIDDSDVRCRMLGYLDNLKGFRLLNISTGQITHSRSVTFDKTVRDTAKSDTDEDVESVDHETELTSIMIDGPVSANSNDCCMRGMASEHQLVHRNQFLTHHLQVFDPREFEVLSRSIGIQPHGADQV